MAEFEIYFTNSNGNRGTDLFVEVTSPDNISFIKNQDSVNIPAGRENAKLKFIMDQKSLMINPHTTIDNVTLITNAHYKEFDFH